ncbi:hypothetical protein L3X38_008119 [Prunus dulcis]|uniref:Uncharacterized protein n=1 Tax=Prunus dulcis TaxID=3755 RepID=A0AAD4ZW22_PRUDU|nr:hypothetical protein L3X38_008119 [Prunus dulcis]
MVVPKNRDLHRFENFNSRFWLYSHHPKVLKSLVHLLSKLGNLSTGRHLEKIRLDLIRRHVQKLLPCQIVHKTRLYIDSMEGATLAGKLLPRYVMLGKSWWDCERSLQPKILGNIHKNC